MTHFGYDKAGNRLSVGRQNGVTTSYTYDSLNRLTDLVNMGSVSTVLSGCHYGLRANGKRQSVKDRTGMTNYTYDDAGNRLSRSITGAASGGGNTLVNGATAYAYDRLTSGGHTYDADGNETTVAG